MMIPISDSRFEKWSELRVQTCAFIEQSHQVGYLTFWHGMTPVVSWRCSDNAGIVPNLNISCRYAFCLFAMYYDTQQIGGTNATKLRIHKCSVRGRNSINTKIV